MEELLLKYINGDCSDQEKITIINWLDADSKNMEEYIKLRKLNDITIWQLSAAIKEKYAYSEKKPIPIYKRVTTIRLLKIAAVFIFGLLVIYNLLNKGLNFKASVEMQKIYVPAGQRAELILGDGTKVWLNAKSTLEFPSQFGRNERRVKLDGEGFFDVSHNKRKPFVVNTDKYNVKVWGTKFNLLAYSNSEVFETSLLEGSVEILPINSAKGIMLKENDHFYLKDKKELIDRINNMDYFLWKEGIICFDNSTFTELVNKLELYFDLKIKVENNQLQNNRYTGKFRMEDGVEHILKVLQLKNKFTYYIDNEKKSILIKD